MQSQWTRQTLMIDADDTLWENNILFDRAIAAFISFLDHKMHTAAEVHEHLNRIEHERVKVHGYGVRSFRLSLLKCFEELHDGPMTEAHEVAITTFTDAILRADMEVLPGVQETLGELSGRHRLLLVTKGNPEEQLEKLSRSGLEGYFSAVEVLHEKHRDAYSNLLKKYACDPSESWMIGNSPKSDVNPAIAEGMHAILVPHTNLWVLEEEPLCEAADGQKLLTVQGFRGLLEHL